MDGDDDDDDCNFCLMIMRAVTWPAWWDPDKIFCFNDVSCAFIGRLGSSEAECLVFRSSGSINDAGN